MKSVTKQTIQAYDRNYHLFASHSQNFYLSPYWVWSNLFWNLQWFHQYNLQDTNIFQDVSHKHDVLPCFCYQIRSQFYLCSDLQVKSFIFWGVIHWISRWKMSMDGSCAIKDFLSSTNKVGKAISPVFYYH